MGIVAMLSRPVSETSVAPPLATGFTLSVAFVASCDLLMGLKAPLITQLCPGASVYTPPPTKQVLDRMVKLAVLHPVVTFVHEIEKEAALNDSGTLPELMTWMS